jgi:hypothetical protein
MPEQIKGSVTFFPLFFLGLLRFPFPGLIGKTFSISRLKRSLPVGIKGDKGDEF